MKALLADIGGTHARFALADAAGMHAPETLHAADFPSLADAACHYLDRHQASVQQAALSVAATLTPGQDEVTFVNHPAWNFSASALGKRLRLDQLKLLNDFEALAYGVTTLGVDDLQQIGGQTVLPNGPVGVLGPGTGLGMAGIIFKDGEPTVIASEGGNATLPVTDRADLALVDIIRATEGRRHISAEDILSGPGLLRLYHAVVARDQQEPRHHSPAAVATAAIERTCPHAIEAVDRFCYLLGVVAGNLALTMQATGGIYLAGGVIPQWGDLFANSRFREGFADKGPYAEYLGVIPVFVVTHPYPALEGLRRVVDY